MKSWWRKLRAGFSRPVALRSHLVLLTASTLLPIIIFTVVIAVFLARREQETFRRGANQRTLALLTAVDEQLKGTIGTLTALATSQRLDTDDLSDFYKEAARVLEKEPNWFTVNLAAPSGKQVLDVPRPFGAPLPTIRERRSFEQVLRSQEPAVGYIVRNPVTNDYEFSVRVPVIRNGVVNYILSAAVKPEIFNELLVPQRLPHDWVGVVLDGNKRIIARTVNAKSTVGQPASQSLQAALSRAPEGWFRGSTIEGAEVYTPYNRSAFSDWTVAMGIPAGTFETALRRALFFVVFLGLAFLASGLILAWFFSAPIARSIQNLSAIAENLGLVEGAVTAAPTPATANSGPSSVSEVEEVRQALFKANHLIRERSDERDRVEAALRQLSTRLELAQEAANVGSFERDLITGEIGWSISQEKLYGLAPGNFGGKAENWAERVHPDDLPATEAKLRRAIETNSSLNLEFRIIRPDGEIRWIASQARVFADEQGAARRLLGVNIDITERKRVEQALAEQARLLDLSHDAILVRDTKDRITYWNHGAEELYGWSREEALGKVTHELLQTEFPEPLQQIMDKLHRDNRWSGDVLHRCRDGKRIYISTRWALDRDPAGRPVSILVSNTDITERKRAEEALTRFNEDLEKCVVEQTAKLMETNTELLRGMEQQRKLEEQLRQSQKMEAIGTLAGGIAHDFNNILGIILGYTHELLGANGDEAENRSQSLEVIASSAERGAKIVKQLLTFARKTGAEHKPLDVNAIIRETLAILKEIFPKNLRFNPNLDPALPTIEGDHNQLQQALINICLNARDAMPEGGTLSIFTRRMSVIDVRDRFGEAKGDHIRIDVSDTGSGMDLETRRRVFEPFFTTKKDGGTGLGLSVVYGIIQTHGGFIDLDSENTGGTTVNIFLPIPSQANLPVESQGRNREEVFSVGHTILVVEDEPHMLELVRLSAEKRGFRTFIAHDGEQAVDLYQKHWKEIDAVVLDWGLPRLDGSAVFRKVKEINPKVTVIGVSGYLDFNLRERMLREGVRDFLQKPCTPNEILEKVLSSTQSATAQDS
ncbi:MAG TPA: PAS domain S-box protein [Candidatus Binatia bacterium]|nr:PAS domain S-box protein [Candidatus Binatia bacterium]